MDINVCAKSDEIPSLPVQEIKENQYELSMKTESIKNYKGQ